MIREEKREYLLKQFTKNTLSIYLDGFEDGFDCIYNEAKKDFEEELQAKNKEVERLKNRIEELIKPKMCDGCKWEQETKIIKTSIGDMVDICKLCNRYEKLQDYFDPKDNA